MADTPIKVRLALEGADQVQAGATRAAGALDKLGQASASAGQRTALSGQQMAQVSAQLQDFFVQIQGGQAPITALLQQGSQLSAVFGGVGNAVKAVGSLISPSLAILGTVAVTVGAVAKAYSDLTNESQNNAKALILSGNAAGLTARQMRDLSAEQSKFVGTQTEVNQAINELVSSGRVLAPVIGSAAEAMTRLNRVGGDASQMLNKLTDIAKDPVAALIRINEAENILTESVYRQVKALVEQGRTTEAARVAQEFYATESIARLKKVEEGLGTLAKAWLDVKKYADETWRSMGERASGAVEQVKDALSLWQRLTAVMSGNAPVQSLVAPSSRQLAADAEASARRAAEAEAARAAAMKATIKADEDAAKAKAKLNAELDREAAALERAIGLSGSYYKDLAEYVKFRQQGKLTEEQYVAAVQKLINAQPIVREQLQAESEARREAQKVLAEQAKAYERSLEAQYRSVERVDEQIQKLKDENAAILLSVESNISLAAAVEMLTAARLTEQRVKADAAGDYLTAAALQAEIDKRKELAGLINAKDAREAAKKSADEAAREWQRSANEIERSITDALMRGFESGKSLAVTLRDTLVNTFKTMVLRPVIQAIVSPVSGALAGGLGFAGAASANTGAGSLSSLLGGSGWFTDFGASVSDLVGSLGIKAFDAGFQQIGTALMANNMSIGSMANTLGSGLGYLSAINNLRQGNYGAGVLGGAGTLAFGPVGGLLGNTIGGLLDKAFGGAGTHHAGAGYVSDGMAGMSVNNGGYGLGWSYGDSVGKYFSPDVETALKTITASSASLLNSLSKNFGGAGGYQVGAYFASDNNRESQGGRSVLLNGQTLSEWNGRGLAADAKAGLEQLTGELAGQVRAAMGQIDLPTWARDQLAALSSSATLDDLGKVVTEINNTKLAITALGAAFPPLATLSDEAVSGLLKAAGGVQALGQSAAVYFDNFYTDAEKSARATSQLSDALQALGLSLPTTREAYRAMVEAQDLSTESGQKAYAALLQMSGAFAQLVPATQDLVTGATTAADAVDRAAEQMIEAGRRALADLASQRGSLEVELLRAQGDITGALARQREQDLARITGSLSAQDAAAAVAAYDLNASLQAQIDATYAAANAAKTAAQAELDRASAAERAAAEVAAAELQRIKAIASERDSLEVAILRATGNTAELRARELAALDASNRPLQERLYALSDEAERQRAAQQLAQEQARAAEQQAADAARAVAEQAREAEQQARAAEQLREAWRGVGVTLMDEVRRIRSLGAAVGTETASAAMARFAIATGQARAFDQDAAKSLPELARNALDLLATTATSTLQLARARAQVAASLEQTAALVGQGGNAASSTPDVSAVLAQVASTAPITATPTNAAAQAVATSTTSLIAEVQALREQVAKLRDDAARTAAATERTRDLLNSSTEGGRAMQTEAYAP